MTENGRHKIVYIEDDQNMIDLVTDVLARDNFEVIGVQEGREGVDIARQVKPSVILLDLMLPDTSGWVVYQLLKQDPELSGIPVIVITARGRSHRQSSGGSTSQKFRLTLPNPSVLTIFVTK